LKASSEVRERLLYALDNDVVAGQSSVANLVGPSRVRGFRPASEFYEGVETFSNLRDAFKAEGFDLDPDGNLRPLLLENLRDEDLTAALFAYVRRARQGSTDAALVTGTGKDLLEATARHVLEQTVLRMRGGTFLEPCTRRLSQLARPRVPGA